MKIALLLFTFVFTVTIRVWGIGRQFPMLGDQIRDWSIASGPLTSLPLIGPPTHFSGYTIGPAFYWVLWVIRVTIGPWFDNLPHGGGIGQAALQSGVDTLLLVAVWHRSGSVWIALTTVLLLATASFDVSLAAVVWNPVVGATLSKLATALVLLDWPRRSPTAMAVTAGIAWCAVQSYTGAVFAALGVFAALLADPLARGDRANARRNVLIIGAVVALLQVPYAVHQVSKQFGDPAMGIVTSSIARILAGSEPLQFARSLSSYAGALSLIQGSPWQLPSLVWVLLVCALVVAFRYRNDPVLLSVTLLPQIASIIGYAFFLGGLEHYYYLSLMPAAVLTVVLGATALPSRRLARVASLALLVGSLALVPARIRHAATLGKVPEYGALLDGSRAMARFPHPLHAIQTEFALPPTCDPEYLYGILGGRIEGASPWVGIIKPDGSVSYVKEE